MYRTLQTKIVYKSYALGNLMYQLPPSGPANLLDFHLMGLGFWIFIMLKRPLEHHFKHHHHILSNERSCHISSQRQVATILVISFTLYFTVLYISLIHRNCVLLYICASFCISDISLLYCCLSCNISVYFFVISPLSFHAQNNLDQWYQSRMLLVIFSMHVPNEVQV
jgi:hypothetical protein